ncbi:MAG: hypothetical protein COA79_18840 [Planctomycetota bacterium]|nr:MAG: hypothetical protein COA79_18840 [Planctomycetota bacterium]
MILWTICMLHLSKLKQLLSQNSLLDFVQAGEKSHLKNRTLNHSIDVSRLAIPISGNHQMYIELNGQACLCDVKPGTMVWMPEGSWNSPTWDQPVETLTLIFDNKSLRLNLMTKEKGQKETILNSIVWNPLPSSGLSELMELIMNSEKKVLRHLLQAFVYMIVELPKPVIHQGKAYQTWKGIHDYIMENASEEITRSSIAKLFQINPGHVSHLYHEFSDQGFADSLNLFRLKISKELLRNSNLTISQIANLSGFESANYFARLFKSEFGLPPSLWTRE